MLIVLDVPQELAEVEVLEEYPAHILVVDRVQDLLLRQRFDLLPRLLIVMPLKIILANGQMGKKLQFCASPDPPTVQ